MDRWTGILKVPLYPKGNAHCRVAASLCISPLSKTLIVPTANAVFFNGDRVEGTGNPVIERLSDIRNIAQILVSKFGASINAWVIEAPTFNGPFALYKEFLSSLNQWGEPQSYKPNGFPASTSVSALLTNFLEEWAKNETHQEGHHQSAPSTFSNLPQTFILGFSKGGVVLNQLVTELGFADAKPMEDSTHIKGGSLSKTLHAHIIPGSRESFLDSISEIHYVDVGLNSPGAYLTDIIMIKGLVERLVDREQGLSFMLHGTPRQWNDKRRTWINEEKEKFRQFLEIEQMNSGGKLKVSERVYFGGNHPNLQMHFEIIEKLVVNSCQKID